MIIEREGTILAVQGDQITVRVAAPEACCGCGKREGCSQGAARVMTLPAPESTLPRCGQTVTLAMPERSLAGIAALVHLLPAVALLIGAATGQALGGTTGWAMAGGLLGMAATLALLRPLSHRLPRLRIALGEAGTDSIHTSCQPGPHHE